MKLVIVQKRLGDCISSGLALRSAAGNQGHEKFQKDADQDQGHDHRETAL
jgi:hypothetical protein